MNYSNEFINNHTNHLLHELFYQLQNLLNLDVLEWKQFDWQLALLWEV